MTTKFPFSIQVLVHLAGNEINVHKNTEVLGIQGKRKTLRKRIDPGIGYGECLKLAFKAYTYTGVQPGFAEHDLDEYDPIADGIAFSRSIACVRKGFRVDNDIEAVRDHHARYMYSGQTDQTMSQIRPYAHVLHAPTLVGGVGTDDLEAFYDELFTPIPANSNTQIRLLSRTIGTDRIVDELFVSLAHSVKIDWLLPGIPPTNRKIEIVIVSIFHVRGDKLESEHIYWDQASVLVQVGSVMQCSQRTRLTIPGRYSGPESCARSVEEERCEAAPSSRSRGHESNQARKQQTYQQPDPRLVASNSGI